MAFSNVYAVEIHAEYELQRRQESFTRQRPQPVTTAPLPAPKRPNPLGTIPRALLAPTPHRQCRTTT